MLGRSAGRGVGARAPLRRGARSGTRPAPGGAPLPLAPLSLPLCGCAAAGGAAPSRPNKTKGRGRCD